MPKGVLALLSRLLPAADWLSRYDRGNLSHDVSAGVAVGAMLVPQSMAYALLAGLPPVAGLYASVIGPVLYSLLGSSRHLSVGPVATDSLLVHASVSPLAEPGTMQYLAAAALLALMAGAFQILFGLLRMGFLSHFMSGAVIGGFTTAAAIVISISQLKYLLGVSVPSSNSAFATLVAVGQRLGQAHGPTLIIALTSMAALVLLRRVAPRFPAPLAVVLLAALSVNAWHLEAQGVQVVGNIPAGLPTPQVPSLELPLVQLLLPRALILALISYGESIAVAQTLAVRSNYRVRPNQELTALGTTNVLNSLVSGYFVTGSFSRSAVTHGVGGRTQLAGAVTGGTVLLAVLLLTPLFESLPQAVLGALVIVAVSGLLDFGQARSLYHLRRADAWTWVITFVATLLLDVQKGLLAGILYSLIVFIWRSSHPHMAELGWVEEEQGFRDLERYPEAETYPEGLILRIDSRLYFANMGFVEDQLREKLTGRLGVEWVVLDMSGVNDIDSTSMAALERLVGDYHKRGIHFSLANMKGPVREMAERAGWDATGTSQIRRVTVVEALHQLGIDERKDHRPSSHI